MEKSVFGIGVIGRMGSVDEGAAVLKKFCEHHYFVNEKALSRGVYLL